MTQDARIGRLRGRPRRPAHTHTQRGGRGATGGAFGVYLVPSRAIHQKRIPGWEEVLVGVTAAARGYEKLL